MTSATRIILCIVLLVTSAGCFDEEEASAETATFRARLTTESARPLLVIEPDQTVQNARYGVFVAATTCPAEAARGPGPTCPDEGFIAAGGALSPADDILFWIPEATTSLIIHLDGRHDGERIILDLANQTWIQGSTPAVGPTYHFAYTPEVSA